MWIYISSHNQHFHSLIVKLCKKIMITILHLKRPLSNNDVMVVSGLERIFMCTCWKFVYMGATTSKCWKSADGLFVSIEFYVTWGLREIYRFEKSFVWRRMVEIKILIMIEVAHIFSMFWKGINITTKTAFEGT